MARAWPRDLSRREGCLTGPCLRQTCPGARHKDMSRRDGGGTGSPGAGPRGLSRRAGCLPGPVCGRRVPVPGTRTCLDGRVAVRDRAGRGVSMARAPLEEPEGLLYRPDILTREEEAGYLDLLAELR